MSAVREYSNQYINGEWVASTNSSESLAVTDSNTAEVIARVPKGSSEDMTKAIEAARDAFDSWSKTEMTVRKELIVKLQEAFARRKAEGVEWLMKELGCTKAFAENVQLAVLGVHTQALLDKIDEFEWVRAAGSVTVVKEPIGVIGCITPWNYPYSQIVLKVVPAMLAGCTVVLKPSEITPIGAYIFAECMHEVGFPKGVFNMVVGAGPGCGEVLAEHPAVDMISFTGSTRAGKRISEVAAQTLKIVRTELGGKSAAVLLDDADMQTIVPTFMQQLINNSGQSCNALSRMLVPRSRYDEVIEIAKAKAEGVKVGQSGDADSDIGPLVSEMQWDRVQGFLEAGVDEGARVVCGGPGKPEGLESGYFVKPTVFADVSNQMTIAREEIFGPVLSILPYDSEEEAIAIANDTIYGLNNAVASANVGRALKVASRLRSGMVMVNNTVMDPQGPFGGYKNSGNAREWGITGMEEYVQTKTVSIPIEEYQKALEL